LQPAPKAPGKDYTAEGLRGLAALNVFLAHFFLCFFPHGFDALFPGLQVSPARDGRIESILRLPLASVLWNGNFAVAIFFVLSGFVLSRPYYAATNLETLRDRYLKRYLRLGIPSAASVLLGYALLRSHSLENLAAASLSHSDWLKSYFAFQPSLAGALQDASYRVIFLGADRYNPPLWTMRIEFIGSLITFAFYTLMPSSGWRKLQHYAIAVVSLGIFMQKDAIYYYAFLLGGLLWILPKPGAFVKYVFLAVGLLLASYQYDAAFRWLPQPSWYEPKWFYNVIGAFLIMWSLRSGMLDGFLGSRPLRLLGRMSYSVYLTHFFVLCTFTCWFYIRFAPLHSVVAWVAADLLLSSALLFVVAYVFERVVDRSGIQFSQWFVRGFSSQPASSALK
jgi:peptidoglycan/LPS O-acetylase OafA/YrhL